MTESPMRSIKTRSDLLVAVEADLRRKLEQCVPPVDQHRRELERVRSELEALRAEKP